MGEYLSEIFSLFLYNLGVDVVYGNQLLDLVVYCRHFDRNDGVNNETRHAVCYQEPSHAL